MSQLIVPDALKSEFAAATDRVELRAADGTFLGFFTPTRKFLADLDPGISDEEMERRFAEGGGRPLTDILRDLEARG